MFRPVRHVTVVKVPQPGPAAQTLATQVITDVAGEPLFGPQELRVQPGQGFPEQDQRRIIHKLALRQRIQELTPVEELRLQVWDLVQAFYGY